MPEPLPNSQLLIYQSEDGRIKLDVRFEGETVWLTQQLMAELFETTQQNVSLHLQNIYAEGELPPEATHKEFLSVRQEGSRKVSRSLEYYNPNSFLTINDRDILTHAGRISHELAVVHAEKEYDTFNRQRITEKSAAPDDFEKAVKQLPPPKAKPAAKRARRRRDT